MPSVALKTFGCKVNLCDSDEIASLLRERGIRAFKAGAPEDTEADAWIINACAVTARAVSKYRKFARAVRRTSPEAVVAVFGCGPTFTGGRPAIEGVREFPRGSLSELVEYVSGLLAPCAGHSLPCAEPGAASGFAVKSALGRTRAFLKVADGCPGGCAYCIIPKLRGPVRSKPALDVEREAAALQAKGHREIVLTAIHLGLWGADLGHGARLAGLVRRVAAAAPLCRIRLSSLEAVEADDSLLSLSDLGLFARHFHLPLQSGDDGILKAMGRRYGAAEFLERTRAVRAAFGTVGLTTDVIVGFPGESDEAFRRTLRTCEAARFTRIHAFPFSPREGTPAATLPGRVEKDKVDARMRELIDLGAELGRAFRSERAGDSELVLAEKKCPGRPGHLEGLDGTYQRIVFQGLDELLGTLVGVKITGAADGFCLASVLDPGPREP